MKYYLVYALDSKGALTKIKGFTKDKNKAKTECFESNCAISEIKNLDEVFTENSHQPLDQLHISLRSSVFGTKQIFKY